MNPAWIALTMLCCQGEGGWPSETPAERMGPYLRVRGGAWYSTGLEFDAIRADGRREIDGKDFGFAGLEAGFDIDGRYSSFVGVETVFSGDVSLRTVSVGAGASFDVGPPLRWLPSVRLSPYAAVTYGTFEVDQEAFGDFKPGPGLRVGVEGDIPFSDFFKIGLFVEARIDRYEYEEDVIEGDEFAGGFGIGGGASAVLKF